ncbi:MAG: MarR family transcriptional regulator, partial [Dermatophilaceae bacterium]
VTPVTPVTPLTIDTTALAGALRIEVNRLAFHLRGPATQFGITPTRLAALVALAKAPHGLRAGDLAEQLGVSAASLTRLVDVLQEAGWVERSRDDADRRVIRLALSTEGLTTLSALRTESTSRLQDHLDDLSPADQETLAEAVPILRGLADRRLTTNDEPT